MGNKAKGVVEQRKFFLEGCIFIKSAVGSYCDSKKSVLGVDPARGSTGLALRYRQNSDKFWFKAVVPKDYGFSKVIDVERVVRKVLKKCSPFVVIEGYAMGSKFGREAAGELGGVLRRLFFYKQRPLLVIAPMSVKAWVQAKGKDQIMLEILDKYGIKIPNNDIADAFVLQEIGHKAISMSEQVVADKVSEEDVRVYLKDQEYKKNSQLAGLHRYQEKVLFSAIHRQGTWINFFDRTSPRGDDG